MKMKLRNQKTINKKAETRKLENSNQNMKKTETSKRKLEKR